jgi:hypothetical protein
LDGNFGFLRLLRIEIGLVLDGIGLVHHENEVVLHEIVGHALKKLVHAKKGLVQAKTGLVMFEKVGSC